MTVFSYDNPKNAHMTTDAIQPTEPTGYQKRERGERTTKKKRKLLCFFLLGTVFLAKNGLKLELLLAMGPGIEPHMCFCSQAASACCP